MQDLAYFPCERWIVREEEFSPGCWLAFLPLPKILAWLICSPLRPDALRATARRD